MRRLSSKTSSFNKKWTYWSYRLSSWSPPTKTTSTWWVDRSTSYSLRIVVGSCILNISSRNRFFRRSILIEWIVILHILWSFQINFYRRRWLKWVRSSIAKWRSSSMINKAGFHRIWRNWSRPSVKCTKDKIQLVFVQKLLSEWYYIFNSLCTDSIPPYTHLSPPHFIFTNHISNFI